MFNNVFLKYLRLIGTILFDTNEYPLLMNVGLTYLPLMPGAQGQWSSVCWVTSVTA